MRRPALACLVGLMTVGSLLSVAGPASAEGDGDGDGDGEQRELPGTNLEADERDDGGHTDTPAWMLGSGIAAVMAVGIGGTVLGRRARADA